MTDIELLRVYSQSRSDDAFARLVESHLGLVYGTALRHVRSPELAEEIAQAVFISLARNAGKLRRETVLAAWLYRTTRNASIDLLRVESRRRQRERVASEMQNMNRNFPDAGLGQFEAILDEALETLHESDRAAILLRFFENKTLREVGASLGTSEDAAQKRISRAIEQLRAIFSRRGCAVSAAALTAVLGAQSAQAVPAGLSGAITAGAALAHQGVPIVGGAFLKGIVMTKMQLMFVGAIAVALSVPFLFQHKSLARERDRNSALRQTFAQLAVDNQVRADIQSPLVTGSPVTDAELLRLRSEVTRLRGQLAERQKPTRSEAHLDATSNSTFQSIPGIENAVGEYPRESWTRAGYATPQDGLMTMYWAELNADAKEYMNSLSPDLRTNSWVRGKTDDEIAQTFTNRPNYLSEFKIVSVSPGPDPDEVLLTYDIINTFGIHEGEGQVAAVPLVRRANVMMVKTEGGWKYGRAF
jgi:RNA polymerase sigma factor (sigma-70 family)